MLKILISAITEESRLYLFKWWEMNQLVSISCFWLLIKTLVTTTKLINPEPALILINKIKKD